MVLSEVVFFSLALLIDYNKRGWSVWMSRSGRGGSEGDSLALTDLGKVTRFLREITCFWSDLHTTGKSV